MEEEDLMDGRRDAFLIVLLSRATLFHRANGRRRSERLRDIMGEHLSTPEAFVWSWSQLRCLPLLCVAVTEVRDAVRVPRTLLTR